MDIKPSFVYMIDLGIYIGVPVVILLFLLVAAIVTIAILVFTIVTKTRELKGEPDSK